MFGTVRLSFHDPFASACGDWSNISRGGVPSSTSILMPSSNISFPLISAFVTFWSFLIWILLLLPLTSHSSLVSENARLISLGVSSALFNRNKPGAVGLIVLFSSETLFCWSENLTIPLTLTLSKISLSSRRMTNFLIFSSAASILLLISLNIWV